MPDAPKTTLYHSELARRGQVVVTIETDLLKSKYANKPDYVMLKMDGHSRRYDTENANCAEALRGLKGRTVTIEATGNRDEAQIVVLGDAQPQAHHSPPPAAPRQAPASQPARQAAPPASQASGDPVKHAKQTLNRGCNGYALCLRAADYVRSDYDAAHPDDPMSPEHFQAMCSTLFIWADRRNVFDGLPIGPANQVLGE